ncbi:nucleotidyl transferase AbiEii/AbiGii toxin family protein [bacterium]|nr:nucleotidyl transferase AbiEii/AbiGii toxin family protein [bacterium]
MPKVLTQIQVDVLEALCAVQPGMDNLYYFTGGTALSEFHFQHRLSEDIDLHTHARDDVDADLHGDAQRLIATLERNQLSVQIVKEARSFIRFQVADSKGEQTTLVDLALDHSPGLDSPVPVDGLPVESLRDMAAKKLMAFFERGQDYPKDAVDLYFLMRVGKFPLEILINLAAQKSADFDDDDALLYLGALLLDCRKPAYLNHMRMLRLLGNLDVDEVGSYLASEGQRLLERIRPAE